MRSVVKGAAPSPEITGKRSARRRARGGVAAHLASVRFVVGLSRWFKIIIMPPDSCEVGFAIRVTSRLDICKTVRPLS